MIIKLIKRDATEKLKDMAGFSTVAGVGFYYEPQLFYINICNSQGRILATSEMYKTKQAAKKAIASFRRNGLKFKVKDMT